mmetsp:Transcript_2080/g.4793  ORF Transcript_2080/g.4793 Transcript_2080/m.4793 type:complete len:183 (-) Transcript_2080:34-582(-)
MVNSSPSRRPIDTFVERMKRTYISQMSRTDSRPQKIVEGLYLGSVGAAYNLSVLKSLNITHILTVCDCLPPKFPDQFNYKVVLAVDDPSERLCKHFRDCIEFIHQSIMSGGIVLVHCFAGVSRSATIVLAYLMRYNAMPLQKAMMLVRSKRSWINPNPGFMAQLRRFEGYLKEQRAQGLLTN